MDERTRPTDELMTVKSKFLSGFRMIIYSSRGPATFASLEKRTTIIGTGKSSETAEGEQTND